MAKASAVSGGTFAWVPAACAGALGQPRGRSRPAASSTNVAELERIAKEELVPLVERHEQVGDVRVVGAMVGIEFVTDKRSITPAPAFQPPSTRRC